ncbi:hypothetical protein GCM10023238_06140 [Streptomyces heliomycini]
MLQAFADAITVSDHQEVDIFDPDTVRATSAHPSRLGTQGGPGTTTRRRADAQSTAHQRPQGRHGRRAVVIVVDDDQAGYENAVLEGGNWIGTGRIEFTEDLSLWIYDGQHRAGGLNQLLSEQEDFEDSPFPSASPWPQPGEEMREFYEVNTNAASVKTDLAWQLLTKMAEADPDLREMLAAEEQGLDHPGRCPSLTSLKKLDGLGGAGSRMPTGARPGATG